MNLDEIAAELDERGVDEVSDALCRHLSSGKLTCLRADFEAELNRRYEVEIDENGA